MNPDATQYLSLVLRNKVAEKAASESQDHENSHQYLNDQKMNQFLIDGKFTLRLDEII
jgi:hypothetical protein